MCLQLFDQINKQLKPIGVHFCSFCQNESHSIAHSNENDKTEYLTGIDRKLNNMNCSYYTNMFIDNLKLLMLLLLNCDYCHMR